MKSYTEYLVFLSSITYYVNYFKDPGLQKIPQRLIAMVLPNLKYLIFISAIRRGAPRTKGARASSVESAP